MESIKLSANESPYNILEKNNKNILKDFKVNRYPDASYKTLRKTYSKLINVDYKNLIATNGSDELIQLIIMTFSKEKDNILALEPTFSEYKKLSQNLGRKYIKVNPKKNLKLNKKLALKKIKNENPKVVFLCSPNNPTGELLKKEYIKKVIEITKGIVVLDQAYIEFYKNTLDLDFKKYKNLIIMRTLSKAYGLASLRIGFGIANKKLINKLNKKRMPFNISGVSNFLAIKLLKEINLEKTIDKILSQKKLIEEKLDQLNINYLNSHSNFIILKTNFNEQIVKRAEKNNIQIRTFNDSPLNKYIRFSVGTKNENNKLIKIIKQVKENGA
ncbi:MAG: histidinol-phosphate transaminase [Bacillota bacterium]